MGNEYKQEIKEYDNFTSTGASCGGHGFQMKFSNGWTISVQWGAGMYGDHRDVSAYSAAYDEERANTRATGWCSGTAEVAVWDSNHTWYEWSRDDLPTAHNNLHGLPFFEPAETYVDGWLWADEVVHLMWLAKHQPPVEKMCRHGDKLYKIT